ncbi:MAG: hypothetical protein O3B84_06985 [Chloroflexi bacterium]|nr:hypothetical protein [Chloroflexota bacterium]
MSSNPFIRRTLVVLFIMIVVTTIVTRNLAPMLLGGALLLSIGTLFYWMRNSGGERASVVLPVPPLSDPTRFEGRVDRMTVDEEELPSTSWKPWETTQYVHAYVIVISGLRYKLDPAPVKRGGYDWLHEGMWVEATLDRSTRVVYDVRRGNDPSVT